MEISNNQYDQGEIPDLLYKYIWSIVRIGGNAGGAVGINFLAIKSRSVVIVLECSSGDVIKKKLFYK